VVNNLVLHTIVSVDMLLLDGSELLVDVDRVNVELCTVMMDNIVEC